MNRRQQLLGLTFGAAFAAAFWPSTAGADVQNAIYIAPNAFSYKIKHMPDLDQRRLLLPNQGAMYCAPTAVMNLFAYAADHGYENLDPGDRNWQAQSNYNDMTGFISDLGSLMGTDPMGGTGNPLPATMAWLFANQAPLTASFYFNSDTWMPPIQALVQNAIQTGGVVAFAYGRYPVEVLLPGSLSVGLRDGGHVVTLSEANRFGSDINIGVRDPADEAQTGLYLATQSPFSTRWFNDAEERVVFFEEWGPLECTVLNFPPPGTRAAIIDSFLTLRPKQGFGWSASNQLIATYVANPFLGDPNGSQQAVTFAPNHSIIDAVLAPEGSSSYALISGIGANPTLVNVNHAAGTWESIVAIPDAIDMVVGRNRKLYVLRENRLHCYDVDPGSATLEGMAFIDSDGRTLAYRDSTDHVIVMLDNHAMVIFDSTLPTGAPAGNIDVPLDIPLGNDISMAVNPVDGKIWFLSEASDLVFSVVDGPAVPLFNSVDLPEVNSPRSISFDDYGDMFIMTPDGLLQYRLDPADNRWKLVPNPLFGDMVEPLMDFQVACSRTNYDPFVHTGPKYINFEPSDNNALFPNSLVQVDCDADINGDRTVNGADLAELLAAWGECEICIGDLSGNRIVNGADLARLLNAWGPCD